MTQLSRRNSREETRQERWESHFFSIALRYSMHSAFASVRVVKCITTKTKATTMERAAAIRIIYWCIVMHLSLLQIIGIASFQLGRHNPSFLYRKSITTSNARTGRKHDVALSPLLAALSSTIAAENDQQKYYQRHAIFQNTNAVSKSFPIPHPEIWRKFVTPTTTEESNRGNHSSPSSFWEQLVSSIQLGANSQKQNQLVNDITVQFDDGKLVHKNLWNSVDFLPNTDIVMMTMITNNLHCCQRIP